MPADPINANPTVLELSDLPTRQINLNDDEDYYDDNNNNTHSTSLLSKKTKLTPLDTFSKEILTLGLWQQYHDQDSKLYSVIDAFSSDSDPESSESEQEQEQEQEQKDVNESKQIKRNKETVEDIESLVLPKNQNIPKTSSSSSSTKQQKLQQQHKLNERYDPIDSQEIYDLISTINDPEHPLTLGQLAVVNLPHIYVTDTGNPEDMAEVFVEITPTITHCSLATLIGLGIRVRLERALPPRFRIVIKVRSGTHQSEKQVNKQLNDKERVAAACENEQLLGVISNMLSNCN